MTVLVTVVAITTGDSVYYITPDDGSGECPTNDNCHTLTYYVENNSFSHTVNATFVLIKGQHQLGTDATIDSVHNITIMAFDSQSSGSPIITCRSPVGLWFSNSTSITIINLVINNCSNHDNTSGALTFNNISGILKLDSITVTNSNCRGTVMNRVKLVEIQKCIFNSNGNGGIEMVDVQNISIKKCSFIQNIAKYGQREGGGLKIKASSSTCPILSLTHSNFTNNTAYYGGGLLIDIQCGNITVGNSHFSYNTVQRLGGGIRVRVINGTHHPNFTFTQSTFEYNTVLGKDVLRNKSEPPGGGGVYMLFSKIKPTTTIKVISCIFNSNNGCIYGGGLAINRDYKTQYSMSMPLINAMIQHSVFQFNNATQSSGIQIYYISINITISNCNFFKNSFGYYVVSFTQTTQWLLRSNATFDNCVFLDNHGTGLSSKEIPNLIMTNTTFVKQVTAIDIIYYGKVSLTNVSVTDSTSVGIKIRCLSILKLKLSDMKIQNNQGTGIRVMGCSGIMLNRSNIIANNTAMLDGGGMAMYDSGTFYLNRNSTLVIRNNTAGRYGGGMYIGGWSQLSVFGYSCTIDANNQTKFAASVKFEQNKAAAGDNIYGGKYYNCDSYWWGRNLIPTRANTVIGLPKQLSNSWNKPSLNSTKPFSVISSDPIAVCLCYDDTVNCSNMSTYKKVYSGEPFNVSLAVVGVGGGANSGNFNITTSTDIELVSGIDDKFIATKSCKTFVYTPRLARSRNVQFRTNVTLNISNSLIPDGYLNISLTILPCPPGLVLDSITKSCVCDGVISQKVPGLRCNVSWMPHPIQYSENNWIGYYKPLNCTIACNDCPFDYCISSNAKFSLSESDIQCNYNRSGVLCGQCKLGLSLMLGSNKCSQCSNDWLALIPVFAISGVLLVVFLIALNLTVSVGSINGLLFYANIVKLNETVFFPKGSIPVISQFIAWLNLDWGIETCFYNGLDSYWKVMLQFIFPLYLWFLVMVIIIACRYSIRVSRLCGHNAVPVLATLVLMSYTKLLRTVTKSLMINTIECGHTKWNVWNVDSNILYLSGKHIVLFSISLVFLIIGVIYTGLVFSSQWLQRYSGKCCKGTRDPVVKLKPLIDAYTGPYKDKYRFWTGLGLIVRILLTVIFTFTSEKSLALNNFFVSLTILLAIPLGSRVYRNKYNAIAEICSLTNLFLLAATTTLSTDMYISTTIFAIISITVEMFLFFSIITVKCYRCFLEKRGRGKRALSIYIQKNYGSIFDDLPSSGIQQREILIFDDN